MIRAYTVIKYIVFVVTVISAGVAIERFVGINYVVAPNALVHPSLTNNASEPMTYNDSEPLAFKDVDSTLNENYFKCILQPSKPFCMLSADKRLELFKSDKSQKSPNIEIIESRLINITSILKETGGHVYHLIDEFLKLMEASHLKAIIIEPSVLFCLLPPSKRFSLLSRGFNPGRLQGSRNIITFGILEKDSAKLNEKNTTNIFLSAGFKILKIHKWIKYWNQTQDKTGLFQTTHYLFIRQQVAAHVVVFYKRNSYLWHASLNSEEIDFEGLLFEEEEIYENSIFKGIPGPHKENSSEYQLFIPNDIRYFLTEIESSKFIECQMIPNFNSSHVNPVLTTEQAIVRAALALRELKIIFAPKMVVFWLWSKSLTGWSKHCNVFYYTPTLELSLTSRSIQGLNLTEVLNENELLKTLNDTISDLDFEFHVDILGLHVKITILSDEDIRMSNKNTEENAIYRFKYPAATLCSTDIFGQKVNIPCYPDPDIQLLLK